jgi:hypothetical protein
MPVQMQQRVLGEVNLFFRSPVALTDEDARACSKP